MDGLAQRRTMSAFSATVSRTEWMSCRPPLRSSEVVDL